MTLRELRKNKGITQRQSAEFLGVPLRTYCNYEKDEQKRGSLKYRFMLEKLYSYGYVDEENGILSLEQIKRACGEVSILLFVWIVRKGESYRIQRRRPAGLYRY